MKPILIILPSKNRPKKIEDFYRTWRKTTDGYSEVLVCLDVDDPKLAEYEKHNDIMFDVDKGGSFANVCNRAFKKFPKYKYYFIVSDDHRLRSKDWELRFMKKIMDNGGKGICYGNDLIQGEKLATAAFVSGNIFRAIKYVVPPGLRHMYTDAVWTELGARLNKLFYFPDVKVEHMHFSVGKSKKDAQYMSVNNLEVANQDKKIYEKWVKERIKNDIKKIESYKD